MKPVVVGCDDIVVGEDVLFAVDPVGEKEQDIAYTFAYVIS